MSRTESEKRVARWVREEIRALTAYHVPEAAGLIKLDAMENPFSWPDELRDAWLTRLRDVQVNRYPHPEAPGVKARLRETMGIPRQAGLILGNGSDELIQMIAMTLGGPGRLILSVEPSFVMYRMIAAFAGLGYAGIPLNGADFSLDEGALLDAVERHQPAVVFIAYPNNPTGNLFPAAALERLIRAAPGLVVIDEAYAPFTDASFLPRLGDYDNLLVMRTLSKMGLAGLRLGLLAGNPDWVEQIDKTRLPYNINVLTQASVAFALEHQSLFDRQTAIIRRERERLHLALSALPGVTAFPSQANFLLVRMPAGRAGAIHAGMRRRGVLVKNLHGAHALLEDCLRLTVGTPEENHAQLDALVAALREG